MKYLYNNWIMLRFSKNDCRIEHFLGKKKKKLLNAIRKLFSCWNTCWLQALPRRRNWRRQIKPPKVAWCFASVRRLPPLPRVGVKCTPRPLRIQIVPHLFTATTFGPRPPLHRSFPKSTNHAINYTVNVSVHDFSRRPLPTSPKTLRWFTAASTTPTSNV